MDCRVISAFTRVFGALCPAMTSEGLPSALFHLAVFGHAGAVLVDLVVTPDVLLELPGLLGAVVNRGYPAAAHPFAALREARRCQRRRRKPHGERGYKRADPHHGQSPLSFLRESTSSRGS